MFLENKMSFFEKKDFKVWIGVFFFYSSLFLMIGRFGYIQKQWELENNLNSQLLLLSRTLSVSLDSYSFPKSNKILKGLVSSSGIMNIYRVQKEDLTGRFYVKNAATAEPSINENLFKKPFNKIPILEHEDKGILSQDNFKTMPFSRTICFKVSSNQFICMEYNLTSEEDSLLQSILLNVYLYILSLVLIFILVLFFRIIVPTRLKYKNLFSSMMSSKSGLQKILSNFPMGVALMDENTFFYANNSFMRLFDLKREDLSDFDMKNKFSKEKLTLFKRSLKKAFSSERVSKFEAKIVVQKNKKEWFQFFISPFTGKKVLLILTPMDELKQKQEAVEDYSLFFQVLSEIRSFPDRMDETEFILKSLESLSSCYGFLFAAYGRKEGEFLILEAKTKRLTELTDLKKISLKSKNEKVSALVQAFLKNRPFGYKNLKSLSYYKKNIRDYKKNIKILDSLSTYGFPLIINDREEGAISVFSKKEEDFEPARTERLEKLVKEICVHIERRRLKDASLMSIEAYENKLHLQIDELERNKRILETQTKEMNVMIDRLIIAKEQAEGANRMKTDFLASISHELRTPLNAILGFSEMMKTEALGKVENKQYKEYVSYIHSSGKYLLSLINDILDLSRVETGRQKMQENWFSFEKELKEIVDEVRFYPKASEKIISFNPPKDQIDLRADERIFKQVILNVLSNAIKFTSAKGHISVQGERLKNGDFEISIQDDGIGIPADKIDTLFQPFAQVENIMTKQYEGSGLGLSLVKKLMEMHGGQAYLESEEGKGTIVYLVFPKQRIRKLKEI
ncbi:MAG: HAMP domain-containing histidine kinase [Alphaproteobacteria bacterium]|nr:HAMP domain-containing histidine kinase [Alphaproteobacteria bacterium]